MGVVLRSLTLVITCLPTTSRRATFIYGGEKKNKVSMWEKRKMY